jgi:tetratricopeptide (TPR) repeat protein
MEPSQARQARRLTRSIQVTGAKSLFAALGLLALFLFSQLLLAGQNPLDKAADLLSRGSLGDSIIMLRQIVADDPGNADAHLMLGTALALQGSRTESIEQMAEAVRLRPNSASVHDRLGMVLSQFVEFKAARQEFETALELDTNFAEAHVNLSLILAQAGELQAAGEHLDQAIELQTDKQAAAYAHYLRAKIWGTQEQIDKSIAELQKAVQLRPEYEQAWSDLGGMRRLALDDRGAREALEKAVTLKPDDGLAQYRLGQLYLQDGQASKAVTHLERALLVDPADLATLYNLERALYKTGTKERVYQVQKQMAEAREKTDRVSDVSLSAARLNTEGLQLEKSGDTRAALAKYRAALDLDPSGFGFELNYALALCRLHRWEEGAMELREVLRHDPNNADATKALYIAREQLSTRSGEIHKRP